MAESSLGRSINLGSDQVPEHYCQPCFDVNSAIKPVAGYCVDCQDSLCLECYTSHLLPKPSRHHQLVDKTTRPKLKQQPQHQQQDTGEKCPRHHGESLQSFCKSHNQLCCKVCLTINHKTCQTDEISKLARNIKSSGELKNINKKLIMLKKDFNEYLSKTEANRSTIQSNYSAAIDEMKKIRDEFERLMTETEHQVELVKEEDLKKVESVTDTCHIVIDEINKMTSNLEKLQNKGGDNERVFISIKRAENELHSMEESLTKLRSDNIDREYKFEPDTKLKALLGELKVLGHLSGLPPAHIEDSAAKVVSIAQQLAKKPTHVKDITVSDKNLQHHGSVPLPNKQIVITDNQNKKVKLIDTNSGSIVSEIQLSGTTRNITKMKTEQVAVTLPDQNKIQILSLKHNILSVDREIKVNGDCYGIVYNDKDQTFIVSYCYPGKVEIINMAGTVVRIIKTDSNGSELFVQPLNVALSQDISVIYVSDTIINSVTLLTMFGDVKAVYRGNGLETPTGICVHKSGLVYVVGRHSHTVHQLDPDSGAFKLMLDQEDGLTDPWSISYCDVEDKIYVGTFTEKLLNVFEMK